MSTVISTWLVKVSLIITNPLNSDIVLGILELLRLHRRVLYIDIDIHHGDAVEEAFYTTDRVMTLSFHKHGDGFYPLSGSMEDVGIGRGKNYAINVPLRDGIDDSSYKFIFESVVSDVMTCYAPEAVVLQCGADSLSGDQLGVFNLSMRGHANCVKFVQSFRLPVVLLGGGGYSPHNVARAWAFETGVALGQDLSPIMPFNEDYEVSLVFLQIGHHNMCRLTPIQSAIRSRVPT